MLEVKGMDVFYGKFQALREVSMRVDKGQIVALIGPNGAGKSTTLKTITGLIKPSTGSITLNGNRIVLQNIPETPREKKSTSRNIERRGTADACDRAHAYVKANSAIDR